MNPAMRAYYEQRAAEYDDWWLGTGLFAQRERPGWQREGAQLVAIVAALEPVGTLDVACGTGFLTRHLAGAVTALDQSDAMLAIARERLPDAELVRADVPPLPAADGSFGRIFTGHFYGHLREPLRDEFSGEARRVAGELVVVDSGGGDHEEVQERLLKDGSGTRSTSAGSPRLPLPLSLVAA